MDHGLAVKSNALEVLEKQLQARSKKGQYGFIVVGSATDAYLYHEEEWKLTEGMLKLFLKYRFPVFISTKSILILRDVKTSRLGTRISVKYNLKMAILNLMSKQIKEIQSILNDRADKGNINLFQIMVPGKQKIYGVKTPVLNELAKKYKEGSFDLVEQLWNSGALEERIIAIKIIEKIGKNDPLRVLALFKKFSKQIDNWAVCDGLGMQFLRGIVKSHQEEIFDLAGRFNHSKDPWQRRLSLVMLEWYTRKAEAHKEIKKLVKNLEDDKEYYVRKAVVWINRNFEKGK